MAQAARKPCTYPGCRSLAEPGSFRCKAHPPQAWTKRPDVKRTLVGRRRQTMRAQVQAEQPFCPDCELEGRVQLGTEMDHQIPISQGGSDDRSNLVMRCHAHHQAKTLREAQAGR